MIAKSVFFLVKNYQFYHRDSLFLRVDQLTILLIEWGRNWGITVRRRRGEGMVFKLVAPCTYVSNNSSKSPSKACKKKA